jgi:hypothetical protein
MFDPHIQQYNTFGPFDTLSLTRLVYNIHDRSERSACRFIMIVIASRGAGTGTNTIVPYNRCAGILRTWKYMGGDKNRSSKFNWLRTLRPENIAHWLTLRWFPTQIFWVRKMHIARWFPTKWQYFFASPRPQPFIPRVRYVVFPWTSRPRPTESLILRPTVTPNGTQVCVRVCA